MVLIMGCTAGGKSSLAFELARRLAGQILSVDSMKVYRRMNIGSAKPSTQRLREIPHHLVDVVEPADSFSLGRYMELADAAIADLRQRNIPIIAAGGTGMYLRGLLEGVFEGPAADAELRERLNQLVRQQGLQPLHVRLGQVDPEAAARIHPNDQKRIVRALEVFELTGKPISTYHTQFRSGNYRHPWVLFELRREKEDASHRINLRVRRMVEQGLVEEVRALWSEGMSPQAAQGVGYAEIIEHLEGRCELTDAIEQIKVNTRRLAKSQRTWFRSFSGTQVLDAATDTTVEEMADRVISRLP